MDIHSILHVKVTFSQVNYNLLSHSFRGTGYVGTCFLHRGYLVSARFGRAVKFKTLYQNAWILDSYTESIFNRE